jgi:hypothetical protein
MTQVMTERANIEQTFTEHEGMQNKNGKNWKIWQKQSYLCNPVHNIPEIRFQRSGDGRSQSVEGRLQDNPKKLP